MKICSITPTEGPTQGGNLVKVACEGIDHQVGVVFDNCPAVVSLVHNQQCFVQAPVHDAGDVDVCIFSQGERFIKHHGYRYQRAKLARQSDLTRLVRTIIRQLKAHVLPTTSMCVDVEYAGQIPEDNLAATYASLPALVITGPDIRENRQLSDNAGPQMSDAHGNFVHCRPAYTADLTFSLVGASSSTVELLNMMSASITYLHQATYLSMHRDAEHPEFGVIRWPLSITGEVRTHLDNPDGIRSFSCQFCVHGFDLSAAAPMSATKPMQQSHIKTVPSGASK